MLNGAQGDDDEAHGGHFALMTGQVGSEGALDDLLVNNFYSLDSESEKGILAAPVHPGWVGWVRIERAFYDFVSGRDEDFLGGADLGDAPGLAAEGGDS